MGKIIKFIDLFEGIGGIRIPFDELGAKCVFSSEFDKFCQITYEANFGEKPEGDITLIEEKNIPNHDLAIQFDCSHEITEKALLIWICPPLDLSRKFVRFTKNSTIEVLVSHMSLQLQFRG